MFGNLAKLMYHRRWYVIGAWLMILVVATSLTLRVGSVLSTSDSGQKGTDSERAATLLHTQLHQNDKQVTLIVLQNPGLTIHDASFRHAVSDEDVRKGIATLNDALAVDPPAAFIAWQSQARAASRRVEIPEESNRDILQTAWRWRLSTPDEARR